MKHITKSKRTIILVGLALLIIPFSWYSSQADDSNRGFKPTPPPPPTTMVEDAKFVEYDTPPAPIGGFDAIKENLRYPEIARKAGVEGVVMVQIMVNEGGDIVDSKIEKSLGNNGCDEAAVAALKSVKWKPATKDGKSVKVWVTVPVKFVLDKKGQTSSKHDLDVIRKKRSTGDKEFVKYDTAFSERVTVVAKRPDKEFVEYDTAPEPKDGYDAVLKNLIYPEVARKAGVEGMVYVTIQLDESGKIIDTEIAKSLGNNGCDEAAVAAIKSVEWKPAMKDGKSLKCWTTVPVAFKLK